MFKIFKYSLYDLMRSKWLYLYLLFFMGAGFALLYLNNDLMSGITNLMNITILLCPLISIIFGTMYYYNSKEFVELLLAQPIKRKTILLGQYLGLSIALSAGFFIGSLVPFLLYGLFVSTLIFDFLILILAGVFLTFIFTAISFFISILNDNKIKGFGLAIFIWLFLAFIYDGIFLLLLFVFNDYPLEAFALSATIFNPIDLSRILVILKLDSAVMLGYTGAVFSDFFGTIWGMLISAFVLLMWVITPIFIFVKIWDRKDF